jgi:hypothetical protein
MTLPSMHPLYHYAAVGVLMIVLYFTAIGPIIRHFETKSLGPTATVFVQPTPSGAAAVTATLVAALKEKALADAVSGRIADLSAAQSTIANTISSATGVSGQMAAALAAGLTAGPPQRQVVEVATTATAKVTPPPTLATDTDIQRDLKAVLADTTIKTDVTTHVDVKWEDKPISPIFAVYAQTGASGIGYTLRKEPGLDLDALSLIQNKSFVPGIGIDHTFKGTSASVGLGVTYNFGLKKIQPVIFVGIKF